jgi:hypothetical protein
MTKKLIKARPEDRDIVGICRPHIVKEGDNEIQMLEVYSCDFCNDKRWGKMSLDEYPHCIGCGKHACHFCLNDVTTEMCFQVGYEGFDGGDNREYDEDPSDDYKFMAFRICRECEKNPPDKLYWLMNKISDVEEQNKILEITKGIVIEEIEMLNKKI